MKIIAILLLILLVLGLQTARAANFSILVQCVDDNALPPNYYIHTLNGDGKNTVAYVEFADQYGNVLALGEWLIERPSGKHPWGFVSIDVDSGVILQAWDENGSLLASLALDGNGRYPRCGAKGWQPGAPSIPVVLTADCSFVQIIDAYGNWHWVTSAGERVLLHYGETLTGNPLNGQSTNPVDYRAITTPCPG